MPDYTEWALKLTYFNKIVSNFGLPDIDLFATSLNTKCRRFVSWFPDRNAYAVDAFTICWNELFFYAFPPFSLILRVLNKVILDKAEGILVIPYWNTQPWFPIFKKLVIGNFLELSSYSVTHVGPRLRRDAGTDRLSWLQRCSQASI